MFKSCHLAALFAWFCALTLRDNQSHIPHTKTHSLWWGWFNIPPADLCRTILHRNGWSQREEGAKHLKKRLVKNNYLWCHCSNNLWGWCQWNIEQHNHFECDLRRAGGGSGREPQERAQNVPETCAECRARSAPLSAVIYYVKTLLLLLVCEPGVCQFAFSKWMSRLKVYIINITLNYFSFCCCISCTSVFRCVW